MRHTSAREFLRTALAALAATGAAAACNEVHQAPTEAPPVQPAYTTFVLDSAWSGTDVGDAWGGVTLLVAPDQSLHIVALDIYNAVVRYHGCASECGDRAHWLGGTGDSLSAFYGTGPSGAGLIPAGVVAMYPLTSYGLASGFRYVSCPGDCQFSSHWQGTTLFQNDSVDFYSYGIHFRPLAVDATGGIHLLFSRSADQLLHYAHCAADCASQGSWQEIGLDSTASALWSSAQTLAVSPTGAVHVLYATTEGLAHAACAADCTVASSWRRETIAGTFLYQGIESIATAFGTDGSLYAAYADFGKTVTFAECGAPCTAPGSWSVAALPLTAYDVSLTADGQGKLYLATSDRSVQVSRCAAGCAGAAAWQTQTVDSARGGGQVAIAVDSAGRVSVASGYGYFPTVLQVSVAKVP